MQQCLRLLIAHHRTCTLQDIKCLVDHEWPRNIQDVDCSCPKTCNNLVYTESSSKLRTWSVGENGVPFAQKSSFRSEVMVPRMRLRRDVLFTFEDLVVSFGGAATLSIGLNFLDAAKLFLFLIEYLVVGVRRLLIFALMWRKRSRN